MLSNNIKTLRMKMGLTENELADMLTVTPQDVLKWENGEQEPSIDTIRKMASIFKVTISEIIDEESHEPKGISKSENVAIDEPKTVLTICENCKRPIYKSEEIVTSTRYVENTPTTCYICSDCDKLKKEKQQQDVEKNSKSHRNKSFVWGTIISIIVLAIGVLTGVSGETSGETIALIALLPIFTFTFVSCLFLNNNLVGEIFLEIASWGFVKFPGLIFEFSLDGFLWLIGIKILFGIMFFILGGLTVLLALFICMPLSAIAYPFAIVKSYKNPELTEKDLC